MTSESDGSWGGGTPPASFSVYSEILSSAVNGGPKDSEEEAEAEGSVVESIGKVDFFVGKNFKELEANEGVKLLPFTVSNYLLALDQVEKKGEIKVLLECGRVLVFTVREGWLEDSKHEARLVLKAPGFGR